MNEAVSIEVFREEHIPGALGLWSATEFIGLSSADEPEALVRYLRRNPGFSFVALDGAGGVAGAVLCGHDGRRGFIHHLAVAPARRQSGVGSRLLERCLQALREAQIVKCHAFVFQDNPFGELFWQPAGWQRRDELLVYSRSID
jgi:ribosomal protein S18 acetylase RimI-like enzyme